MIVYGVKIGGAWLFKVLLPYYNTTQIAQAITSSFLSDMSEIFTQVSTHILLHFKYKKNN